MCFSEGRKWLENHVTTQSSFMANGVGMGANMVWKVELGPKGGFYNICTLAAVVFMIGHGCGLKLRQAGAILGTVIVIRMELHGE